VLKSQGLVVLLKLAGASADWTYVAVAQSLGMSASETHAAVARTKACGMYNEHTRAPHRKAP